MEHQLMIDWINWRRRWSIWWCYRCPRILDISCICRGNWRAIVKDTEGLLDKRFRNDRGEEYSFFGIVHGSDDYYYGMWSKEHGMHLLSCVGSIEGHGYTVSASQDRSP